MPGWGRALLNVYLDGSKFHEEARKDLEELKADLVMERYGTRPWWWSTRRRDERAAQIEKLLDVIEMTGYHLHKLKADSLIIETPDGQLDFVEISEGGYQCLEQKFEDGRFIARFRMKE